MNRYYISATFDLAIPEGDDEHIELDRSIDEGFAEAVGGIESFGDRSAGGFTAYDLADNVPVTIEELEDLEELLSALSRSWGADRVPGLSECVVYDTEEGSYSGISQWSDELIEVFESELQQAASNGPLGQCLDLEGEWLLYTPLGVISAYRRAVQGAIEKLKSRR